MNDKPNPAPSPTVEEILIAIFRLLVVIAIAAVTTIALLIMAAYGTPQPSGSAHVDQLHTAANGPLFRSLHRSLWKSARPGKTRFGLFSVG